MANPEEAVEPTGETDRRESSSSNKYRRSIFNVPVTVTVSIGQARLSVSEILELRPESIVPLTSRIDDPVDLAIDNKIIARGELVETEDGTLGVKITEIAEQASDALG
ncbi:MAG: FliM/FliN family flagellar motor switch protein [Rhodospirillales bacterium]|tara:strand:- start:31726 stop:32049 length:324 start_codon:yes stop_codon:yes gene_type:complete